MHSTETEKALTLLTERLERLEKQNRWLVRIALAMGAVLLLVVTLGAVPGQPDTKDIARTVPGQISNQGIVSAVPGLPETQEIVRTKNLQIVDDDGTVRIGLGFVDDPTRPNEGVERVPTLSLYDEDGNARFRLRLTSGEPYLGMYDEEGNVCASLVVYGSDPNLIMWDVGGHMRAELGLFSGIAQLNLFDEHGHLIFTEP